MSFMPRQNPEDHKSQQSGICTTFPLSAVTTAQGAGSKGHADNQSCMANIAMLEPGRHTRCTPTETPPIGGEKPSLQV